MITTIKSTQRRHAGHGPFQIDIVLPGINFDPVKDPGFYNLGRFDHAHLKPGAFVAMHAHQNDEILSLLKKGTMLHRDTGGNLTPLSPTHLMMMNAGSGIFHEESIPRDKYADDVELLQIFIRPEKENEVPNVQFADFSAEISMNKWRLIAGPNKSNAPLFIRSNIIVWDATIREQRIDLPGSIFANTAYLVYVFSGQVKITSKNLNYSKGDSVIIFDEEQVEFESLDDSILVAFVIDREAVYTRNGMFSGMKK